MFIDTDKIKSNLMFLRTVPKVIDGIQSFAKRKEITFEETLKHLHTNLDRVEASFASKLIATINPDLPVWDKEVLGNIDSELNYINLKTNDRINLCVDRYEAMKNWYKKKLNS